MGGNRILQVITDTDRRGAQVFADDLHMALQDRGRHVRTVALAEGDSSAGLDVAVLGSRRLGFPTLLALRNEIRNADVVIGHGSSTLAACAVAGERTGVPFVYRQISDQHFWANTAARRMRVRLFLTRARAVVALWSGAGAILSEDFGVPPRKVTVIPNGVPLSRFPVLDRSVRPSARRDFGIEVEAPTLLYLGALVPEKGVDTAIRALAHRGRWQLLVVGGGPHRSALERLAERVAPGRVHFRPPVQQASDALAAADVLVLPSRGGDSMPAVLIEAGLSGLAAVSTPIGGIVDIIDHGRTGLLVPPDDVAALGVAAEEALARGEDFGVAARRHCAARFGIDVVAQDWDRVLQRAAGHAEPQVLRTVDAAGTSPPGGLDLPPSSLHS